MEKEVFNEYVNSLGIYQLRSLARSVGVPSPTTKKREDLITEIIAIKSGDVKPSNPSNLGRPAKKPTTIDNIISMILVTEDNEITELARKTKHTVSNDVVFAQDAPPLDPNSPLSGVQIVYEGHAKRTNLGNFYVKNEGTNYTGCVVTVETSFIESNKIIEGDYVKGTANLSEATNIAKSISIHEINGKSASENTEPKEFEPIIKKRILEEPDFAMGDHKILSAPSLDDGIRFIADRAKQFVKSGKKVVIFAPEITVSTRIRLDGLESVRLYTTFLDSSSTETFEKMTDMQLHVNALYKHGFDVVVFIVDILSLYHIFDLYYKNTLPFHCEDTERAIRKNFAMCRASENASITCYGMYFDDQTEFFEEELRDLAKNK